MKEGSEVKMVKEYSEEGGMGGLGLGLFERKEGGGGETKFQKGEDTNENRALNDKAVIYYVVSLK